MGAMKGKRCSKRREDGTPCPKWAEVYPIIQLRANLNHKPAEGHLNIPLCKRCAKGVTVRTILGVDGYSQIVDRFAEMGKEAPQRELTTLRFDRLKKMPPGIRDEPFPGFDQGGAADA